MYVVTDIRELDVRRCKIYLDEQLVFVLYKGELKQMEISLNKELSEEKYTKILKEILPKRAKKRALYLLQKKAYTEWQLREKLREGYYPQAAIEEAITYVKGYHYIDDLSFAREYIYFRKEKLSKKVIEEKLRAKGIGKEELQMVMQEAYPDRQEEEELQLELAINLLKKRSYNKKTADEKERQKLYAFLMRKGISPSVIKRALWEEIVSD